MIAQKFSAMALYAEMNASEESRKNVLKGNKIVHDLSLMGLMEIILARKFMEKNLLKSKREFTKSYGIFEQRDKLKFWLIFCSTNKNNLRPK